MKLRGDAMKKWAGTRSGVIFGGPGGRESVDPTAKPVDRKRETGYIGAMQPLPPLAATGIGSVPYRDHKEAVALILKHFPEVPFWPQLVQLGFR
jgi:hypothetical protein